jgi:hypothetical protein
MNSRTIGTVILMKRLCLFRTTLRQETGDDFENLTARGYYGFKGAAKACFKRLV